MTTAAADVMLALARGTPERCGCGRPLSPVLNEAGERIGVTHTPEDEDWHCAFWGGTVVEPVTEEQS